MVWMRCSSGLKVTWGFSLFLLPLGRPGLPFGAFCCRWCVFLWLVACVATFSASVRTIGSTMVGYERRCWVLINDKGKKDSPGTGLPSKDEKKRSTPSVFFPDLVTTHASPPRRYPSSGWHKCERKNTQNTVAQGLPVYKKRWTVRELPPLPAQRERLHIVTRPLIANRATMIRLNGRTVVVVKDGRGHWKRVTISLRGGLRCRLCVVDLGNTTLNDNGAPYLTSFWRRYCLVGPI